MIVGSFSATSTLLLRDSLALVMAIARQPLRYDLTKPEATTAVQTPKL